MARSRVELDTQVFYWRTAALIFFLSQLADWTHLPRRFRPGRRILFSLVSMPRSFLVGLIAAVLLTVVARVIVDSIVRPLVERWHAPEVDESLGGFHMAPNEWIIQHSPARRSIGWRWPVGTLMRTNLRLWFFPQAHGAEVWSCPLESLSDVHLASSPAIAWGLIRNWPAEVVVRAQGNELERFAVPEPGRVTAWFDHAPTGKPLDPVHSPLD